MAAKTGKPVPEASAEQKPVPEVTEITKEVPKGTQRKKEPPQVGKPENTVTIGGKLVEIKPTKLKYQRDRTAAFYRLMDVYSLPEILAMDKEAIGDEERDGDKCVFDWLIAVTDDPEMIKENYDSLDSEVIEKMLLIFKRLNHIDEKEEKRKNLQALRGLV